MKALFSPILSCGIGGRVWWAVQDCIFTMESVSTLYLNLESLPLGEMIPKGGQSQNDFQS